MCFLDTIFPTHIKNNSYINKIIPNFTTYLQAVGQLREQETRWNKTTSIKDNIIGHCVIQIFSTSIVRVKLIREKGNPRYTNFSQKLFELI